MLASDPVASRPEVHRRKETPTLWGHPVGLYILTFVELWERCSFFGIFYVLVTFLKTPVEAGGWGWEGEPAYTLAGLHGLLLYLGGIPFGRLADRYLGKKNAIFIGGMALMTGHTSLFFLYEHKAFFFCGLLFLILGTGLIKGNISTLAGELYRKGDPQKNQGFYIFYMGVNVGMFLAASVVSWVCKERGWQYGFALPAAGVCSGMVVFIAGQRYLPREETAPPKSSILTWLAGLACCSGLVWLLVCGTGWDAALIDLVKGHYVLLANGLAGALALLVVGVLCYLIRDAADPRERSRMIAFALSTIPMLCFYIGYKQSSGTVMDYTARNTAKLFFLGIALPKLVIQSLGPIFAIFSAVPLNYLWERIKREFPFVNTASQMGAGLVFLGLSFAFLLGAQMEKSHAPDGTFSLFWLVGTYLFLTLGELSLLPAALAFSSNMAPRHKGGLLLGVQFAAIGLGTYLAAKTGPLSTTHTGSKLVFQLSCMVPILLGLLFILLTPVFGRLAQEGEIRAKGYGKRRRPRWRKKEPAKQPQLPGK